MVKQIDDDITEILTAPAICLDNEDLETILPKLKPVLRNIPRIPNIIRKTGIYRTFSIVDDEKDLKGQLYALVEDGCADYLGLDASTTLHIRKEFDYFTHTEIFSKLLPEGLALSAFETLGNIIHLNLRDEQLPYKDIIGEVLYRKTGCTVVNKVGQIDNEFRTYKSEVLAGPAVLNTVHCENDIKIYLCLDKVYWCSKLQTERKRIVDMVKPGEVVCDPFCGAGPQVLPILKKNGIVYANDLNHVAIYCLKRSLDLNRLREKEEDKIFNMDAKAFIEFLAGKHIDHFVFNLPEHSLEYISLLRNFAGFTLHCFFFCRKEEQPEEAVFRTSGLRVDKAYLRKVRMVSPTKAVYKLEIGSDALFSSAPLQ